MPEHHNRPYAHLEAGALVGASGALGAAVGAVAANNLFPKSIEYAPGIEAEVALSTNEGLHLDAVLSHVTAPNVPIETALPGVDGLDVAITKFSPHNAADAVSLVATFHETVMQPTSEALAEHLIRGAGIGSLGAMALASTALIYARRKKQARADLHTHIQELRDDPDASPESLRIADELETKDRKTQRFRSLRRKCAATLASLALAVGVLSGDQPKETEQAPRPAEQITPLNNYISERIPALKGATMTGISGDITNTAAFAGVEFAEKYIKNVDNFWKQAGNNLTEKYASLQENDRLPEAINPDVIPILFVSDLHCNYSAYDNFFPSVFSALKPQIILNAGDTFTNSNTMPYESACRSDFIKKVQQQDEAADTQTAIIEVSGNHDPKNDSEDGVTILNGDQGRVTTVDGLTFVGEDDPSRTMWWPTQPEDPEELRTVLAEQGSTVAQEACAIKAETGTAPIVITHQNQAGFESILNACASLVLNGHTHNYRDMQRFETTSGESVLQHTTGSATGADVGITIYQKPNKNATFSLLYFNTATKQFESILGITVHTDRTVTLKKQTIPAQPNVPQEEYEKMREFLETYSETYPKTVPSMYAAAAKVQKP